MRPSRSLLSLAFLVLTSTAGCASSEEDPTEAAEEAMVELPMVTCVNPASSTPTPACTLPSDLDRVARKFLKANSRLYELQGGHRDFTTCADYNKHLYGRDFSLSSRKVIDAISTAQPKQLWSGTSEYQMTFDRNTGAIYGKNDEHPPIAPGMVFVLTLRITGFYFIPVAFEVVDLDPATGRFAFSYVVQNKSQGIQQLTFTDTPSGSHVDHETRFKSNSEFRDNHLYVPFHEKLLREFYGALEARLSASQ